VQDVAKFRFYDIDGRYILPWRLAAYLHNLYVAGCEVYCRISASGRGLHLAVAQEKDDPYISLFSDPNFEEIKKYKMLLWETTRGSGRMRKTKRVSEWFRVKDLGGLYLEKN